MKRWLNLKVEGFCVMRKGIIISRVLAVAAGAGFLAAGIVLGQYKDVLQKAIRVCLECIGIG